MINHRTQKVEENLKRLAADFLRRESGLQSLITVVDVNFDSDKKRASIIISVLPQEKTATAFRFVNRQKIHFVKFLKKTARMKTIPTISFALETPQID